jgi:hypothetical protein
MNMMCLILQTIEIVQYFSNPDTEFAARRVICYSLVTVHLRQDFLLELHNTLSGESFYQHVLCIVCTCVTDISAKIPCIQEAPRGVAESIRERITGEI